MTGLNQNPVCLHIRPLSVLPDYGICLNICGISCLDRSSQDKSSARHQNLKILINRQVASLISPLFVIGEKQSVALIGRLCPLHFFLRFHHSVIGSIRRIVIQRIVGCQDDAVLDHLIFFCCFIIMNAVKALG